MSGNLGYQSIGASQSQKEVTANDNFALFDDAATEDMAVDTTAGHVTITTSQMQHNVFFKRTDSTSSRHVTYPAVKRLFIFYNAGATAVGVVIGSTTVSVIAAEKAIFYADGTTNGLDRVASSAASGASFLPLSGGTLTGDLIIDTTGVIVNNSAPTVINGTSGGTATCYMPEQGASHKKVIIVLDNWEDSTSLTQAFTFPTPFALANDFTINSLPPATDLTLTEVALPASTTGAVSGLIIVEGV